MLEYNYEIKHISGKNNAVADALSRINCIKQKQTKMDTKEYNQIKNKVRFTTTETSELQKFSIKTTANEILISYKNRNTDTFIQDDLITCIQEIKKLCDEKEIHELGIIDDQDSGTETLEQRKNTEKLLIDNFSPIQIYWIKYANTPENISKFLKEIHEDLLHLHYGITRTFKYLKATGYHWTGMKSDIIEYIKNCPTCQIKKITRKKSREPMIITDTSTRPFEKISLDFIGPLPLTENGNQHILVIQDDLTKFTIVRATPTHDTQTVAKILIEIFCTFGIPRKLRTDKDIVFCFAFITEINNRLGIQKLECTPYHPESNGAIERTNASIKEDLKIRINTKRNDWDYYLPETTYSFNSAVHNSTGITPFELLFGYQPPVNTPDQPTYTYEEYLEQQKEILKDLHTAARQKQVKTKKKTKARYDKTANERDFQVGKYVKLKSRNTQTTRGALSNPYEGPYKIIKINPPNVAIDIDGKTQTYHANRLIPYEKDENQSHASTSKISRISTLLTYLFIFFLPTTKAFEFIREIEHKSGLFYNFQGFVGNHVSDYTLITGFNLEQIHQSIISLQQIQDNINNVINEN